MTATHETLARPASLGNAATSTANGDMLLRIGQNLKVGPADPIPMPFRLPALPASMHSETVKIDLPQPHGSTMFP